MASNLFFHYTGGASNADPDASLGGVHSSVVLDTVALNNLFDNVNPPEIESENLVEYRGIDLTNDGDVEAHNVQFYIEDTPNSESRWDTWYQEVPGEITDESQEPGPGAVWTQPLVGSKLDLDDLAAAGYYRIWVRRTVNQDSTNINADTAVLHAWFS